MFNSLIPLLFIAFLGALLWLVRSYIVNKHYPKKTNAMLDTLPALESIGMVRDANGYNGKYRDFLVYIYATSVPLSNRNFNNNLSVGNKFQVWVLAAPQPGELKGVGGFFGKYLVSGEKPGYAMVGFILNYNTTSTPAEDIKVKLDALIDILIQRSIKPYSM